jgi:hypothetical protein
MERVTVSGQGVTARRHLDEFEAGSRGFQREQKNDDKDQVERVYLVPGADSPSAARAAFAEALGEQAKEFDIN